MKLIITGATGSVATEVLRQSLRNPAITSVIAVSRKPVTGLPNLSSDSDISKLQSVIVKDYGSYPEDVKKKFAGAGGCIWTVAITPLRSTAYNFSDVERICQEWTMAGLEAMYSADTVKPFRFLYMSGRGVERDQSKPRSFLSQYSLMRGQTENKVLAFAEEYQGKVEASVVKPGLIAGTGNPLQRTMTAITSYVAPKLTIALEDLAAVMVDEIVRGFEKNTLEMEDLVRIKNTAIKEVDAS